MQVAVLGGSSPFTLAFVRELARRAAELETVALRLVGRDRDALALVGAAARAHVTPLGWTVEATDSLARGLAGADHIVQQIRFEGLTGRADDEAFAHELGCPADETLGPAALRRALRLAGPVRRLGRTIAADAPGARVWNLTNPLSLTTALLAESGVRTPLGICELPQTTARRAAAACGFDGNGLTFDVVGLNHRAFVVGLGGGGRDLLAELIARGIELPWTTAAIVRELGAIPTKYHALLANGGAPVAAGRAAVLAALRRRLFEELRAAPEQLPPSLGERVTDWYEEAVVPGLVASAAAAPVRLVLDLVDADGLARERCVSVGRNAVEALPAPAVPAGVRPWLARFEAHERRVLELLRAPSPDHLAAALASDPTCPDSIVERAVEILVRDGSLEEHQ